MTKNIEIIGNVLEVLPNSTFKIITNDKNIIFAYLSGKMRKNYIKILKGDKVMLAVSPYDASKGIIKIRFKN